MDFGRSFPLAVDAEIREDRTALLMNSSDSAYRDPSLTITLSNGHSCTGKMVRSPAVDSRMVQVHDILSYGEVGSLPGAALCLKVS